MKAETVYFSKCRYDMTKCDYYDRLQLEDGQLVRVVTAVSKRKKDDGKSYDVYKEFEDGHQEARNLYFSMLGYCVGFPGDKNKNGYIEEEEEYVDCHLQYFLEYTSRLINEEEKKLISAFYPGFKYTMNKWTGTIHDTLQAVRIWTEHPEVEFLLAAGYENLAFSKSFWKKTVAKRKQIVAFLKDNDDADFRFQYRKLSEICFIMKHRLTASQYAEYRNFCQLYGRVSYPVFKYLLPLKNYRNIYNPVRFYRDYLELLNQTEHDKTSDYWLYPKRLRDRHNKLYEEVNAVKLLKEKEAREKKQKDYRKAVRKYLEVSVSSNGYKVFIPSTLQQIERQAEELNQCLIYCDYIKRVIDKQCILVFLYKNGKPAATAEIKGRNSIGQFYTDERSDDCLPNDKMKAALNCWIQAKRKKDRGAKAK